MTTTQSYPHSVVKMIDSEVVESRKTKVLKWCSRTWKLMLAEMICVILLIFLGCMTEMPLFGAPPNPLSISFAFGFTVMFCIQMFGHISGGHMNPCISVAAAILGELSIPTAVAYSVAQITGGIIGYWFLIHVAPVDVVAEKVCVNHIYDGLRVWQALVIEIAITFAITLMSCSVMDPMNKDKVEALPIKFGMAIVALSIVAGPLTGCGMNPARSIGPFLHTGIWTDFWVWILGPLTGGVLASLLYKYVWLTKEESETEVQMQDGENKVK
ncbi:hypothetical protein O0L34_g4494 [Tuta absoluta]|nr:hypothetical protein O0L34_g4494 [Tuta absoluta]